MDSNSAENPHSPTGARRHSTSDKPDTTKRRVPIHLRASVGSCHDLCKYGKSHYSDEITKLPFRKRNSKSLPNVSLKTIVSEPSRATASKSSPNDPKSVKTMASGVQNTKKNAPLANISPRQSALSGNKTRSPKLSCSVSETPEIIKREILLFPSENVEAPVEEGSSNGNKTSRTDKKMSDQSANCSSSENPKSIKPKMLIASGRNMMSSVVASAEKASESPTARVSSKFYLGKTASSKAREEAGKVKLSLSSPLKHRCGTEKSNGEGLEKTLHVIKTETEKATKTGGAKLSSPPSRSIGIRNFKTEAESNASTSTSLPVSSSRAEFPSLSSRAKSLSLSSREEKDEGGEIQNTVSIKIEENHARTKSLSSSSHEDVEVDELIEDKISSLEIEYHDTDPSSSSSLEEEEDEEEMYPSSSASSSVSSLEENDEEINDELVSDKSISTDIGKSQSSNENRTSLRKSQSVRSEDKNNHLAVKLKFRRGKIIDIQAENNVPKRLKFRRARNGDKTNKTDDCAPDGKKSIITETGNVKPGTPSKKTLRKADSFISDNKKNSMDMKPGTPNRSLRKSRSVASEDKYCSPVSLSRRDQTGNKSPTRLKFARGRVSRVEDAKSDSLRKNIKRVGSDNEVAGDESPRNVVLKHPEVQMKNNGQVLLNNVIKETASKLVESRKSKVKALVGAFETVISLHETRPAASSHAVG